MSGHLSIIYPQTIEFWRHAKNNLLPDADFYGQTHAALNHILAYRGAGAFHRSNLLGYTRASGTNTVWRWRQRTGYGQTRLQVVGILGLSSSSAADPAVTITVVKSGGGTQSITVYGGATDATPSDSPSEWSLFEHTFDVDPASVYECSLATVDYGAILSLLSRQLGNTEIDDSIDYYTEFEATGTGPIFDVNQQRLVEGAGRIIRRNRGIHTSWCLFDGSARTRTSATLINLINNSSTGSPTATTPGYRFTTTALGTVSRSTTVPVEVAVYGSNATSTGTVQLVNTSGATVVTVTINSATPQWFTGTGTITVGSSVKYDLQFNSAGGSTTSVLAASIAGYES